jgi:4-diphosphocytidyl-2-C-methyl-D-erythritol kinase
MIDFSNAKINIGLNIVSKRDDGYHNLESVFYPIKPYDVLELIEASQNELHLYGLPIPGDKSDNLCLKALVLMQDRYSVPPQHIHLLKHLPTGAGLGAGSANAAFVIKMLNRTYDLGIDPEELKSLALTLGSDCPFFIENVPQLAKGRGEILEKMDIDLQNYTIALIKPKIAVSTKMAFQAIRPNDQRSSITELIQLPIEKWEGNIVNDFEPGIFEMHPELSDIKKYLYDSGAIYASMSGTGSCIYGIFPSQPKLNWKDSWISFSR